MASALASLTANYTDSEGEEDVSRLEDRLHPALAERLGKLGDSPASSGSQGSLVRPTNSQGGEEMWNVRSETTLIIFQGRRQRKLSLCPTLTRTRVSVTMTDSLVMSDVQDDVYDEDHDIV